MSTERHIEWRSIESARRFGAEPLYIAALERLGLTCPAGNCVKQNYNRQSCGVGRLLCETRGDEILGANLYAEFLLKLANQRICRGFARIYLASGELPETSMMLLQWAFVHQPPAFCIVQGAGHD